MCVREIVSKGSTPRRRAGAFAVEILGKRLLSCPTAFAESWSRTRQGFSHQEAAPEAELAAAERTVRQETGDDREAQEREATAATVVGAWLRNFIDDVGDQIRDIEAALDTLGFNLDGAPITEQTPVADARFETLVLLIERLLRENAAHSGGAGEDGAFHPGERLIVFTEYKTTLDYLARRLRERYPADRVLTLFGSGGPEGMDETGREHVKAAFNDPAAPVRVLVATDAASEGLNLHRTARYLLHYDCPWNPSRLEQRNGRIDRYGQARDVTVHHFVSTTDPDLRFLDHVIRKADEIREDLGSVNDVFDRAAHRRLVRGEDAASVQADLDRAIAATRGSGVGWARCMSSASWRGRNTLKERALGVLTRSRYPGAGNEASRWTVRLGSVPDGADAIVLLSIEELGVNELRETFHRWVCTLALPVSNGLPGEPLTHAPAQTLRGARDTVDPNDRARATDIFDDVGAGLQEWLRRYRDALTERLRRQLGVDGKVARTREGERYRERQGEVSTLIEQSTLARLTREIEALTGRAQQRGLFDDDERLAELERSIEEKQEELTRRRRHYEEIRDQLQRERARILEHLLPARFALAGSAQVFPVAVEIRLPERSH